MASDGKSLGGFRRAFAPAKDSCLHESPCSEVNLVKTRDRAVENINLDSREYDMRQKAIEVTRRHCEKREKP